MLNRDMGLHIGERHIMDALTRAIRTFVEVLGVLPSFPILLASGCQMSSSLSVHLLPCHADVCFLVPAGGE